MPNSASFIFHGKLNDFLTPENKYRQLNYTFNDHPSVKDAVEAISVPHFEVGTILINGQTADFNVSLQNNDSIQVFPLSAADIQSLKAEGEIRFIADVHLGKLARGLRLLGFDTLYENNYSKKTLVKKASEESRIVLTRDVVLLKHKAIKAGYWLRSQQFEEQLMEVTSHFGLQELFKPFARCTICNGKLIAVSKEDVIDQLLPKTQACFNEFFQCSCCKRIYWKGSHYDKMQQLINKLKK